MSDEEERAREFIDAFEWELKTVEDGVGEIRLRMRYDGAAEPTIKGQEAFERYVRHTLHSADAMAESVGLDIRELVRVIWSTMMHARLRPTPRIITPGVCHRCGCTEANACPGGCAWTDREQTLCTSCA